MDLNFDADAMAVAALKRQLQCQCDRCRLEIIVTYLRTEHLFREAPAGDVDPNDWIWSSSVCEPFTTLEMALFETDDEEFIRRAFPVLASLIEKEINARYEDCLWGPPEHLRGLLCANVTYH